jgi:predicted TPR repeat methyltransferase
MPNPALNPIVLLSPVENGYVGYDPTSDCLHELNPLACLIAELCDGRRSVETIRDIVGPLLPEGQAAEVDRWINQAIEAGLLTWSGSAAAGQRELSGKELNDIAHRLRDNGKTKTAFICQQRATELAPDDAEAWCYLGDLAHIVGRREVARAAYEKYLEFEPDDAEVKHLLVALRDEAPPPRVPDECIQQLYRRFSTFYESNVCDSLGYEGPKRIRELLEPIFGNRRELAVLDLGCGSGLAGVQFKPWSTRLVGVDLSPEMIELSRARNLYDRLDVAEITKWLQLNPDRFDLILCCDTLIYFGDLRVLVATVANQLNQNGVFAFSVERGERSPFHLTDSGRYTHHPDHIREAGKEAGLNVERLEEDFLRMEYGNEVTGLFVALKKQG